MSTGTFPSWVGPRVAAPPVADDYLMAVLSAYGLAVYFHRGLVPGTAFVTWFLHGPRAGTRFGLRLTARIPAHWPAIVERYDGRGIELVRCLPDPWIWVVPLVAGAPWHMAYLEDVPEAALPILLEERHE